MTIAAPAMLSREQVMAEFLAANGWGGVVPARLAVVPR